MKQFKKYLLPLALVAMLGAGVFASCERDEGYVEPETRNLTLEVKAFEEAAKKAALYSSVSGNERLVSAKLSLMVKEAKELIYATGVSEHELSKLYRSDEAIVRQALDICVEQSKILNK